MNRTTAKLRKTFTGVTALTLVVLGLPLAVTQLVLAAPPAPLGFTVTPEVPLPGQTATFSATSTRPGDSVSWDFQNDGTVDATGSTVQHVYTTPGQRTVVMRVMRDNDVKEVVKVVRVDAPPSASFTATPSVAMPGQTVAFDGSASSDSDGKIVKYQWDLDGDGSFETVTGSTPTTSKVYAAPGTVTVKLRVTDNDGAVGEKSATVVVNSRPVARFSASPNPTLVGEAVTFDAGASSDPDGRIANHEWDFDNDGQFDDASGVTATRSFGTAGAHTVRLLVTDDRGASDTLTSTVNVDALPAGPPPDQAPPPPDQAPPPPDQAAPFPDLAPPFPNPAPVATVTELMSPFPVVRLVAELSRRGARVKLLRVSGVPRGARVTVRCRGARCRLRRSSTLISSGRSRFRSFERHFSVGESLQIRITQPGKIGKYTSFKIRRSQAPLRRDLCVASSSAKPTTCPSL